ncbi:ribonuclease H-like domain-containing protein [Tanacetum coccineum]
MDLETAQTNTTEKLPILKQENDNSFKPIARTTANADGTSTLMIRGLVTTEEKAQKKNDIKARSKLLMTLPNEHQLTFNQYMDAKTLFDVIQTRFGGNDATKKTQKTLLKQMYENFNAPAQNLDTISFDDLYNYFKIVEQEVKRTVTSSSNSSSQNMAFVLSPSSTNEVNTANVQVSTANSPVSTADTLDSTANLNDLEEIDLKWQLALLSMRARRYFQRTGKKITINRSDTAGYDKSKVECFNCHKMGHFARECRGHRNQDNRNKNQDNSKRTMNVEETSSKALVAIDGADSEVYNDKTCSNTCLKSFVTLKTQYDNLRIEFNLATYKRGLASVEEQLVFYKKNKVMLCDQIVVLKRDTPFKDSEINALKSEIKKLKKEKESNQIKIDKFKNDSKILDKLIGSQISDNNRKGVGFISYSVVPPPPIGLFAPSTIDLSNSGLEEFQQLEFEGYRPKASKSVCVDTSNEVKKTPNVLLVEELVLEKEKQIVFPTKIESVKQQKKPTKKPVKLTAITIKGKGWLKAVNTTRPKAINIARPTSTVVNAVRANQGHPQKEDQGYVNSGCSRHMTGNMSYLSDFKEFDGGYVTFGGGAKGGRITSKGTLKTEILVDKKVKIIRCDNGTEFKNRVMNEFYEKKGIKREFSVARTPQQNGVAKKRNRILIKVARTMLADSKLPTTFWAEAVNTACYVHNRVIIVKPHNKTPYELFRGRTHALSFMRPFGCHVTILNTLDHLGKFNRKSYDSFFVGYSLTSKAFRVYNIRTRKVEENLHIRFFEDKPIVIGDGPKWLFDIDSLTKSMNYVPVVAGANSNDFTGSEESNGAGHSSKETESSQDYIMMPLWKDGSTFDSSSKNSSDDEAQPSCNVEIKDNEDVSKASRFSDQEQPESSTPNINTVGPSINTASANLKTGSLNINTASPTIITTRSNRSQDLSDMFSLGRILTTPNTRIHKDHSLDHVIGDIQSGVQTRGITKNTNEHGFISAIYEGKTHEELHTCLFAYFLSQEEPKRIAKALSDPAWVEAMQEEFLQIEAIRLFLVYASFMGFMVYQMDVKSAFLYGIIKEEVYVCQPLGFKDPDYLDKVYKVVKALYGFHQAPRAWRTQLLLRFASEAKRRWDIYLSG